jgi:hypothetical protein
MMSRLLDFDPAAKTSPNVGCWLDTGEQEDGEVVARKAAVSLPSATTKAHILSLIFLFHHNP